MCAKAIVVKITNTVKRPYASLSEKNHNSFKWMDDADGNVPPEGEVGVRREILCTIISGVTWC